MRSVFCLLAPVVLLLSTTAHAAERLPGPLSAEVIRVIDGDTLEVHVKIWLGTQITTKVRVADVDTPELSRPGCPRERMLGEKAKALAEAAIGPGAVTLYDIEHGKYAGRVVARVETRDGDLAEIMREAGLDGEDWC